MISWLSFHTAMTPAARISRATRLLYCIALFWGTGPLSYSGLDFDDVLFAVEVGM